MINNEFSIEFDILYNNITSNQAPGLNEYEKSVFLTKAEYQLVYEYFNKKLDSSEGGFDGSSKRQTDFSNLITWTTLSKVNTSDINVFDDRSVVFLAPKDMLYSLNETISFKDATICTVIPISYEEYTRVLSKPYKYPTKGKAWRLITNTIGAGDVSEYVQNTVSEIITGKYGSIFKIIFKSNPDNTEDVKVLIVVHPRDPDKILADSENLDYHITQSVVESVESYRNEGYNIIEIIGGSVEDAEHSILDSSLPEIEVETLNTDYNNIEDIWDISSIVSIIDCPGSKIVSNEETMVGLEIIVNKPADEIVEYKMRYVRTPKPIILSSLEEGLSIGGFDSEMSCELPEELHHEILERAVTLAKISWQGSTVTQAVLASQNNKK